ncbi:arginase family protein [Vibrio sp. LaRot3]|uniref:arginase family protein n=1 Tax=Vibrio sp. LaRot3 TaxID=2998829 RepID=UPI0022CE1750|nr:arginase family protein [Vibrio sp. LaRot3]MDA0147637.1 arginase family protein [Vibrio sp. LaRot3]
MKRGFDLIGAPFNQLGIFATEQNTVDGLRRLNETSWIGLSDWLEVRTTRWQADIIDRGDINASEPVNALIARRDKEQALAEYSSMLHAQVLQSYQAGRTPVTIGGDHSIAIGTVQATLDYFQRQQGKRVAVIWVDAHADCNDSLASNLHGKPLALLMDKYPHNGWQVKPELVLNPTDVYYVGVRDLMPNEHELMTKHQMVNFDMNTIERIGINGVLEQLVSIVDERYDAVYVSFDYDALDGTQFRACGTPNVGGLSAREALHLVHGLSRHEKFVGIDFVEYLPELDNDEVSKELMIKLIDAVWGFTM